MLSQFTWIQFIVVMAIASAIWVVYVLRHRLMGTASRKGKGDGQPNKERRTWQVVGSEQTDSSPPSENGRYMPADNDQRLHTRDTGLYTKYPAESEDEEMLPEDAFSDVSTVALEISEITAKLGPITTEEELFAAFKDTLAKYPTLTSPAHQTAVNHLMIRCALKDCGYNVSMEQVASLWPTHTANH
jgi:hypothetical protein